MILTFRYRIKNEKNLSEKACAVNFVWNFCKESQKKAMRYGRRWPSKFDLNKLCAGTSKELGIHSDTISATAFQFAKSRNQHKRPPRWRVSSGSRRSLGWVPFGVARAVTIGLGYIQYLGVKYPIWMHRPIKGKLLCGSFTEDASGKWYVNLRCEVEPEPCNGIEDIGIDLGLKDLATLSTGEAIENPCRYREMELKLAIAQRASRKKQARAIHAKIKNRRRHDLHVISKKLVKRSKSIFVGNVNSSGLGKTRMAKSVYDTAWTLFRNMLEYKSKYAAITFRVVNEAFSTRVCSVCKSDSGPKGLKDLGVRQWQCSECGTHHNRDVNASKNILLSGMNMCLQ